MLTQGTTHRGRLIISLVLTLPFSLAILQAQSTLNFPRLSFEENVITGLAIVNPTNNDAEVTITAYGEDGQLLAGIPTNPATVMVEANRQIATVTSLLFGEGPAPETVGWFQATSPVDDLTGFFLFQDLPLPASFLDGADLPATTDKIVFAQVRLDSGYSTEVNLINPSSSAAELQLQLVQPGAQTVNQTLSLPAMGVARLDVATFFEITEAPSDPYVTVTSDVEIAGFELVRAPEGDLVGLNARNGNEKLTRLHFPFVTVLGPFITQVGVVNNSDQAVILTFSVLKSDGNLFDTELQQNGVQRGLESGQILIEDLVSMFGFTGTDPLQGWLKVDSSLPAITGFLTYGAPETGSAATVTPDRLGLSQAIFSHIATFQTTDQSFLTGVAVLNPGQLAANVSIFALTPDGEVLGSFGTVLRPQAQIAQVVTDLIPQAADRNGGWIFLRSNLPVYFSSLFASTDQKLLANIPPQPSPKTFIPPGEELAKIIPPLAIVQPSQSQPFTAQNLSGNITWKVNDIDGGNAQFGTIAADGTYTAPAQVPFLSRIVTVAAAGDFQSAGASVDVLEKEAILAPTERIVQSVTYLGSLKRLYIAELAVLSSAGRFSEPQSTSPTQNNNSELLEIASPGAPKVLVAKFDNETIVKMITFTSSDGQEFLLLAGQETGQIYRFDPVKKQSVVVVSGLDQPNALVINPLSGNLLVAEKNKVTLISKTQLEADLLTAARTSPPNPGPQAVTLFPTAGADGVAVDRCTGDVYISDSQLGVIRRFVVLTQEVIDLFSGQLNQPGQLLALYRNGVSCPDAFQLLVVETGADRLTLLTPAQNLLTPWISAAQSTDVAFLPGGTPFAGTSAILLTELVGGQPQQTGTGFILSLVGVPGLYASEPPNEPTDGKTSPDAPVVFADENFEACVKAALNLVDGLVTLQLAESLTSLNCSFQSLPPGSEEIKLLAGLESFVKLTEFRVRGNLLARAPQLANLLQLTILDLAENRFSSFRLEAAVAGLVGLKELDLCDQLNQSPFGDVAGIINLDFVTDLVNLEELRLCSLVVKGRITDITPLSGLTQLRVLDLQNNLINDISPLVDNSGLASGDSVDLRDNPLDTGDCSNILALTSRGVAVQHDVTCP